MQIHGPGHTYPVAWVSRAIIHLTSFQPVHSDAAFRKQYDH